MFSYKNLFTIVWISYRRILNTHKIYYFITSVLKKNKNNSADGVFIPNLHSSIDLSECIKWDNFIQCIFVPHSVRLIYPHCIDTVTFEFKKKKTNKIPPPKSLYSTRQHLIDYNKFVCCSFSYQKYKLMFSNQNVRYVIKIYVNSHLLSTYDTRKEFFF